MLLNEQFHNAGKSVFGNVDNKLLCTWHVDRAWHEKLTLIKDKETQMAQLVSSNGRDRGEESLNAIDKDSTATPDKCYHNRIWSIHQQSFINTNVHVEDWKHSTMC